MKMFFGSCVRVYHQGFKYLIGWDLGKAEGRGQDAPCLAYHLNVTVVFLATNHSSGARHQAGNCRIWRIKQEHKL